MASSDNTNQDRRFYERNALIRYLNHRHPDGFRLIWDTYLAVQNARWRGKPLPLSPITPILQVRQWKKTPTRQTGQHILFFSFTGWSTHIVMDGLLGKALEQRGARVSYFTCGGIMPVCHIHNVASNVPPMPCGRCRAYADSALTAYGFKPMMMKDLVSAEERQRFEKEIAAIPDDQLTTYERDGVRFGYIASVSVRWFYIADNLDESPEMRLRLRDFMLVEMMAHVAIQRLIERDRPDKIIVFNGVLDAENVVRTVADQAGIPYITTERGQLAGTMVAAHRGSVSIYPWEDLWEKYRQQPLTPAQAEQLTSYLDNRRYGYKQLDNLWANVQEDIDQVQAEVGLQPGRPLFAAFTNVFGDTAVIDRELAYGSIFEWIDHLVAIFTAHPELDLVFRIHPAETRVERYKPRQTAQDYFVQKYPALPPNIKIIPSESRLSSYTLVGMSEMVMVYTSTIGLEAVLMGKPATVSAQVHYRDKGFTCDVASPQEMVNWIERWQTGQLPAVNVELARRYAHLFFFRAMIPFEEILEESGFGQMRLKVTGDADLVEGRNRAVDAFCTAILNGTPFLNPYLED